MSRSVFWENKKNITNLSFAELAQGMVKVKTPTGICVYASWYCVYFTYCGTFVKYSVVFHLQIFFNNYVS